MDNTMIRNYDIEQIRKYQAEKSTYTPSDRTFGAALIIAILIFGLGFYIGARAERANHQNIETARTK